MLPLHLQMEIDLSAAAHKRDIAEGFAELRRKLLPERRPTQEELYLQALMEAMRPARGAELQAFGLSAAGWNPYTHPLQASANNYGGGLFGGLMGYYRPW